ncbi:response regulator [Pontixanthobacter gangjinensis]|uniref:Response regulator n=1 Tax=Pontixanthobacter gangjinensis TaxID=1028742 RepID=A0A6I4SMT4_9SPHN|nr:response regulator [Pontixanthobacter gangjinensis]MXO56127.1 response regulator [Pontixanthobacter gangjinensis]
MSKLAKTILVVEDDTLIAMAIEAIASDAGAESIDTCTTTSEALVALKNKDYDAVVLDVHLSDSDDGWEVAELLQNLGPAAPKIVFSTGSPDSIPEDIARFGTVLAKPYQEKDLVAALQLPVGGLLRRFARPA